MMVMGGRALTVGEYVDRRQVNPLLSAAAGFFSLAVICLLVGLIPSLAGWDTIAAIWNAIFMVEADGDAVREFSFAAAAVLAVLMVVSLGAAPFVYRRVPWRGEVLRRVLRVIVSDGSDSAKFVDRGTPMSEVRAKVRRRRWCVEISLALVYFDPVLWSGRDVCAMLGASSIVNDADKLTIYYGDGLERSYEEAERKAGLR